MSRNSITIGDKTFNSKSKALAFYRDILNSYETGDYIKSVMVDFNPDFRSTKCFYIIGSEGKQLYSYMLPINGVLSKNQLFSRACRHLVVERLREFKKQQFKNRPVKCAITNEIVEWEECQIDHKAPLTFSVIVKSFIVAYKIDINSVGYVYENSKEQFTDKDIADKFVAFHKDMAVLRVLSTKQNRKLSGGARIKPSKKDGTLT